VPKAFQYPYEGEVPAQYMTSARPMFFDRIVERYLTDIKQSGRPRFIGGDCVTSADGANQTGKEMHNGKR
jgi:hypothetical protein